MKDGYHLERGAELEKFRMKLLDRMLTIRSFHGVNVPFDQLWYEFLTRHFIWEEKSTEKIYDDFCTELEQRVTL